MTKGGPAPSHLPSPVSECCCLELPRANEAVLQGLWGQLDLGLNLCCHSLPL